MDTFWVNGNEIADLIALVDAVSAQFPNLTYLSLFKNPACPNFFMGKDDDDYKRYRNYVLYRLPNLKFLDAAPVTAADLAEAKRVGAFSIPARPTAAKSVETMRADASAAGGADGDVVDGSEQTADGMYGPLPDDTEDKIGAGGAYFGVRRYQYHGAHSQGNRFISDPDL